MQNDAVMELPAVTEQNLELLSDDEWAGQIAADGTTEANYRIRTRRWNPFGERDLHYEPPSRYKPIHYQK